MANPNADASAEAKTAAAAAVLPDDFTFEVDRSRHASEVRGEHPLNLGWIQDGIPFDKAGRLLKAALKDAENFPGAAAAVQRKLARLTKEHKAAEKEPGDEAAVFTVAPQVDEDPDADVDLVQWAYGTIKLQPHVVNRVARKRMGKHFRSMAEIRDEMIARKMVDEARVKA